METVRTRFFPPLTLYPMIISFSFPSRRRVNKILSVHTFTVVFFFFFALKGIVDSGESGMIKDDGTLSSESRSIDTASSHLLTAEIDDEQQVCLLTSDMIIMQCYD